MPLSAKRASAGSANFFPEPTLPSRPVPPPVPTHQAMSPRLEDARSPQSAASKRASYFAGDAPSPSTPTTSEKRSSRIPPVPLPTVLMSSPAQIRSPPPPPPPTAAPRVPEELNEGESEYEGDYDTDIGSGEKHKDALKEASFEDGATARPDLPFRSPAQPPAMPPLPAQRAVPPPPPQIPTARQSMDSPRAAPPPVPPPRNVPATEHDDVYSNYTRYQESTRGAPPPPPPSAPAPPPIVEEPQDMLQESSDDLYDVSPPSQSVDRPPPPPPVAVMEERAVPAPPSHAAPPPVRAPPRQSLDAARSSTNRRSMEAPKPMNDGYIAADVDLAEQTQWWAHKDQPPPVFRNRSDVLCEIEESSTSKRGGKTTVSKDVYVLFPDYSQTVVTARFDSRDLGDVSLEQRHEPPPARLRQDQLEQYWQRFGSRIADAAASTKDKVVGDGTPNALVLDLIRALNGALLPVGTRAYGALVYANLANASVQQFDEIRPGDIITLRNVKLQGKHGTMHQKYSMDVGATAQSAQGHVAVVVDWDGTKKKVRAWEQGREKNKVRMESFRLGDLRSGEVRVWRVVGRPWVGWE